MSGLYVSSFEENGIVKWGIFYADSKGVQHLSEDFKPVEFITKDEADTKLRAMETERSNEDSAVAFTPEEARIFVERHKWKYASTYAKTAPHEYLVKKWLSEDEKHQFERLVQTINKDSVIGYFYGHKNNYLILGDYYYWYMPVYPDNMAVDLINRTTVDYLEYRDGAYYYKPKLITEENADESNRL